MHGLLRLMCLDVVRITYISFYVSQFTEGALSPSSDRSFRDLNRPERK